MSAYTKQAPGTYQRLNMNTQKHETRQNRALRRMILARGRKASRPLQKKYRENLLTREWKASRVYTE